MTILLPTLAVAFAAFCVWLTVRIVNRKERWAKWTLAAMIGLPVLYVASFGPACLIAQSGNLLDEAARVFYQPLSCARANGPPWLTTAIYDYAAIWSGNSVATIYTVELLLAR